VGILTNLARGISLEGLISETGISPLHQFMARIGTNDFSCVRMSFERPRGSFYFLFRNGQLTTIQDLPRVDFETRTYNGKPWRVPKPVDPEVRMIAVIQAQDLSPVEIVERLQQWTRAEAVASKGKEPLNILPAFILTAPLFLAKAPSRLSGETEAARLTEKFDPFKIKLGMTADEVRSIVDDPILTVKTNSNCELRVYGSELPASLSVHIPPVWVSVMFCDNEVTSVFSHDFFDKRLLTVAGESRDGRKRK